MKKIINGIIIVCLVLAISLLVLNFNKIDTAQSNTISSEKIEGNSVEGKRSINIQPATFCLYDSLPLYGDDCDEVIKNLTLLEEVDVMHKYTTGYTIAASDVFKVVGIDKPYFLKINKDKVTVDQIKSFLVTGNAASGVDYIEFLGENSVNEEFNRDDIYLINIDEDYLQKHEVALNDLNILSDSILETSVFDEAVKYIREEFGHIYFISENVDETNMRQEILDNYKLKLYQIGDLSPQKLFIASFEPNSDDYPYTHFSFIYFNQEIKKFGFHFGFNSFSIDDKWYLAFTNAISPGSGNVGKEVYTIENDQFSRFNVDYSRAD